MLPSVILLTATCGRHTLLERCVRFFLDQDYQGDHALLIYNNSDVPQSLGRLDMPSNKSIFLVNNHIDSITGLPYSTLGAIYNDLITFIPKEYAVVNHADDDDIYLPWHISAGVQGLLKGERKAYKPQLSYYRSPRGIEKSSNTLEPSIFLYRETLQEYGYSLETTEQHLQWEVPLKNSGELFVDKEGPPTLIYNWGDTDIFTFKTSGDFRNPNNFNNYRTHSRDHGDQIITPWLSEDVQKYYNLINNRINGL